MSEFEILGAKNYIPFITNIQIEDWGQTVIIDCTCDPEKTQSYKIICLDCEEIKWFFNKEELDCLDDSVVDVLDFYIKRNNNKKVISLYACVVELYLTCKNIKLEKSW